MNIPEQDPAELEKARRIGQQAVSGTDVTSPTDIVTDALAEIAKYYVLIPKPD